MRERAPYGARSFLLFNFKEWLLLFVRLSIIAAGVLLALLINVSPALAHDKGTIEHKNSYLRAKVTKLFNERAAGCDLVNLKCKKYQNPKPAKIRRYFNTLRRKIMPKPAAINLNNAKPLQPPAGVPTARATGAPLSAIRQCESNGNYSTNTGNGFYGAYQFTQSTWNSVGGVGNPAAASPAEQDKRAAILYAREGSSPWPVCGK